jgi:uncharacterized protein (DUF1697 family)
MFQVSDLDPDPDLDPTIMPARHVALLRGINVGGKHIVPMKELAGIFEAAGASEVVTYIQSGNVVCAASAAVVKKLPGTLERAIEKRFGFGVPIVMRSAEELGEVVRRNPFLSKVPSVERLHVAFLAHEPSAGGVAALDPQRSPPDELVVRGREIYLNLPNGAGKTKLTNAYLDSTLGTTSTMRNWRTVLTLLDLASR